MAATMPLHGSNFPDPRIDQTAQSAKREQLVLAGGCFWGMEDLFGRLRGVQKVVSGYSGGDKKSAHSNLVEAGHTGHAESVMITYDPSQITYGQLLKVFFSVAHDPTEVNRQGPDVGSQYRSVVFYKTDEQKSIAEAYIKQLNDAHTFPSPIATQLAPFNGFYPAEEFLQHYSRRHPDDPYVIQNDVPRLRTLQRNYPDLVTSDNGQR